MHSVLFDCVSVYVPVRNKFLYATYLKLIYEYLQNLQQTLLTYYPGNV